MPTATASASPATALFSRVDSVGAWIAPAALRALPPHPILVGSLVNRASIVVSIARLGLPNQVLTIGTTA